ncbi:MAG: hypothetical protein HYT75_01310 [Deltaproteobacteria bacterium]|nr:hypothetical protein [Deltaproteobacteria bacterium]
MSKSPEIVAGNRLPEYLRERVQKAILTQNLQISETTEFYLVDLLKKFERSDYVFVPTEDHFDHEPLALMYARALNGDSATQIRELKRLGDVSLYLAGLFPEHLEKGLVGVNYYTDMGSGAYASLAGQLAGEKVFTELYSELSEKFAGLALALGEMSLADYAVNNIELLKLYERWIKTGDDRIKKRLVQEGLFPADKKISC